MNMVFMFVFCVELIMKWIGMGIKSYFTERANIFDFMIIIMFLLEMFLLM